MTVVTRANVAILFPWVPDSGWLLALSKLIDWPNGGKTARKGAKMATLERICYAGENGATPLSVQS